MGKIWVREFTGGLDGRRMPETTSGAVLVKALNGHITRGGEFEKRQAFVRAYILPEGETFGLAADASSLYVFGKGSTPAGMPSGVSYQRLVHPTNSSLQVSGINSFDLYAGKIYVSAKFSDGSNHMYYDGDYVDSWSNGFAKGWFTVEPNEIEPATSPTGVLRVSSGSSGDALTTLKYGDTELISATVLHTGNNGTTAEAIKTAINAYTGTSGFTATRSGWKVLVTAPLGTRYNKEEVKTVFGAGTPNLEEIDVLSGGTEEVVPKVKNIWVGRDKIVNVTVPWVSNAVTMAADIATAINSYSGTSGYSATSSGRKVKVASLVAGSSFNGRKITYTGVNGFSIDEKQKLSGGTEKSLPKGTYVRTIGTKMYGVAGDTLHFSGIAAPTDWTTDTVGAGFIDLSTQISGAEKLQAVTAYQNQIAVFGEVSTVIEYVDPDPELNKLTQVLQNTGTISPKSVTQFGNSDIFYLDSSGVRSLRARDASDTASTNDTGVAIDDLIIAKLGTMSAANKANCIGVIEPRGNRFWLAMRNIVYVFSYFAGAKVSAWSKYDLTAFLGAGETQFNAEYMTVFGKSVYIRDGDKIFVYGSVDGTEVYDETVAEAWLPYLDANDPTRKKNFTGFDVACEGTWEVAVAMDPINQGTEEIVSTVTETTYNHDRNPGLGEATHISLRFRTASASKAKLASCAILFAGDDIEDR